jgi:hypothetical protein
MGMTFASWWRISVLDFGNWVSGSYYHSAVSQFLSLHLLCNPPLYFPVLCTSPPSPVSLADRRLLLLSNGLTKFISHWYVPELH